MRKQYQCSASQNLYRWNPAPLRIKGFTLFPWDNSLSPYHKVTRIRARNQPPPQEDPVTRDNKPFFLSVYPRTSWNEMHNIQSTVSPLLGCLNSLKHHKCKLKPSKWLKGKKEKENTECNPYTDTISTVALAVHILVCFWDKNPVFR